MVESSKGNRCNKPFLVLILLSMTSMTSFLTATLAHVSLLGLARLGEGRDWRISAILGWGVSRSRRKCNET